MIGEAETHGCCTPAVALVTASPTSLNVRKISTPGLRIVCTKALVYGLLPSPNGEGFELACPPVFEGATYMMSSGSDIHSEMAKLQIPVRIVRARQRTTEIGADFSSSPTDPNLWKSFPQATDREVVELSHFIPMEAPELVAAEIEAMIAQVSLVPK